MKGRQERRLLWLRWDRAESVWKLQIGSELEANTRNREIKIPSEVFKVI